VQAEERRTGLIPQSVELRERGFVEVAEVARQQQKGVHFRQ